MTRCFFAAFIPGFLTSKSKLRPAGAAPAPPGEKGVPLAPSRAPPKPAAASPEQMGEPPKPRKPPFSSEKHRQERQRHSPPMGRGHRAQFRCVPGNRESRAGVLGGNHGGESLRSRWKQNSRSRRQSEISDDRTGAGSCTRRTISQPAHRTTRQTAPQIPPAQSGGPPSAPHASLPAPSPQMRCNPSATIPCPGDPHTGPARASAAPYLPR